MMLHAGESVVINQEVCCQAKLPNDLSVYSVSLLIARVKIEGKPINS